MFIISCSIFKDKFSTKYHILRGSCFTGEHEGATASFDRQVRLTALVSRE